MDIDDTENEIAPVAKKPKKSTKRVATTIEEATHIKARAIIVLAEAKAFKIKTKALRKASRIKCNAIEEAANIKATAREEAALIKAQGEDYGDEGVKSQEQAENGFFEIRGYDVDDDDQDVPSEDDNGGSSNKRQRESYDEEYAEPVSKRVKDSERARAMSRLRKS